MRVLSMIVAGERQAAKPCDISDIRRICVRYVYIYIGRGGKAMIKWGH